MCNFVRQIAIFPFRRLETVGQMPLALPYSGFLAIWWRFYPYTGGQVVLYMSSWTEDNSPISSDGATQSERARAPATLPALQLAAMFSFCFLK